MTHLLKTTQYKTYPFCRLTQYCPNKLHSLANSVPRPLRRPRHNHRLQTPPSRNTVVGGREGVRYGSLVRRGSILFDSCFFIFLGPVSGTMVVQGLCSIRPSSNFKRGANVGLRPPLTPFERRWCMVCARFTPLWSVDTATSRDTKTVHPGGTVHTGGKDGKSRTNICGGFCPVIEAKYHASLTHFCE